MFKGQLENKV